MPEGPEVKNDAEFLHRHLAGREITSIEVRERHKIINLSYLPIGIKIVSVSAYGKKIIFQFENNVYILVELRMEGKFRFNEAPLHTWIILYFDGFYLSFSDHRYFCRFEICNYAKIHETLAELGPDIITMGVNRSYFNEQIYKRRRTNICSFLLDQSVFAGIGNYLKADILYYARIYPGMTVGQLTDVQKDSLYYYIHEIPRRSYAQGACTLGSYRHIDGTPGAYEKAVYGRTVDITGQYRVITEVICGRNTYYCPDVQIPPNAYVNPQIYLFSS